MSRRTVQEMLERTTPRQRLSVSAAAALLILGFIVHWHSPASRAARNIRASQEFGEALQRAGIQTQPGPSR